MLILCAAGNVAAPTVVVNRREALLTLMVCPFNRTTKYKNVRMRRKYGIRPHALIGLGPIPNIPRCNFAGLYLS